MQPFVSCEGLSRKTVLSQMSWVVLKSPKHRVKAGHFTTRDRLQVAGFPVIVRAGDRTSPALVVVYIAPEFPEKYGRKISRSPIHSNSCMMSIVTLFADWGATICEYFVQLLNLLMVDDPGNLYWGSGCVPLGKVRLDTSGFIGTAEAYPMLSILYLMISLKKTGFHGNRVAVYVKNKDDQVGEIANANWTRYVLHDFGDLNA
ncbi:hypothetical protein EV360DRAFT_85751 [Lentinula raphanica]|nr:hypothetical protein EV360DRAFT_85751 [Lentinula raphanica]